MSERDRTPKPPASKVSHDTAQRKKYAEGMLAALSVAEDAARAASAPPNTDEALAKLRAAGVQPVDFKGLIITNPPPPRPKPPPVVPQPPAWFRFAVLYLALAVVVALCLRARR